MFDLNKLKKDTTPNNRYERLLENLLAQDHQIDRIKTVVDNAIANLEGSQKSFVIYGEPQSGKTEMMIALTAKFLDAGVRLVIILLNDSVQLLGQNLERFQRSGLSPTPKKFSEVLPPEVTIGDYQWVIFCKKNSKDLQKLLEKIEGHSNRVIVDDEADCGGVLWPVHGWRSLLKKEWRGPRCLPILYPNEIHDWLWAGRRRPARP